MIPVRRLLGSPLLEALAAPHGVDRYLELVNPRWSLREVRAEVTAVRRDTPDTVTLSLRPNGNWRGFQAGQYTRFGVEIDGVRRTRCFSIASSQHRADRLVEITVKAGGTVSRYLRDRATPGLVLTMSQADGEFVLPAQRPDRLLLISGGSGITPVMSMLRTLCDEGHPGRVTLLHYASTERDVIYRDELARLAARHPTVRVKHVHTSRSGHFRPEHLVAADPVLTYLCGPEPLMDAVRTHYADAGLTDRLHYERFTLARFAPAAGDATGQVHFTGSDRTVPNDGTPLLDQAERAGLTPEYGCRMGVCLTCSTHVEAGAVRDLRTGAVGPADAEVQLCVSVPVGDVAVAL